MKRKLFLFKTTEYIQELAVMYGVLSVLNDNGILARLMNKPSAYVIECEDFNPEELVIIPSESERNFKLIASTKMTFQSDYIMILKKMFGERTDGEEGYFSEPSHIADMIRYLETQDESYIAKKRHGIADQSQTYYGSIYGVKGQRGVSKTAGNNKLLAPIKFWSTLGFMRASSALTINGNIELTWLPIPSSEGVTEVVRYEAFPVAYDEEGEPYLRAFTRADSDQIGFALQVLKMQQWLMAGDTQDEFSGVLYAQSFPAGQRSLNGRVDTFELLPLSESVIDFLIKLLNIRAVPFDTKQRISSLIINRQASNFTHFIHAMSKDPNGRLALSYAKELSDMFNQSELFSNPGINKYSNALKVMMYANKGHNMQLALMNVTSPQGLTSALSRIGDQYARMRDGSKVIAIEDLQSIMTFVGNDSQAARNVAQMILLLSTTYTVKIDKKETAEEASSLQLA